MHELGIVTHVINTIEETCTEDHLTHVGSVTLQIGEVSGIVPSYLTDCWKWAAEKSEVLKGSELKIEMTEAITDCLDCHQSYRTVEYGKECPFCHSTHTVLNHGTECSIKEIFAE